MNIQKGHEIKKMLNVKQIVHYQVRQEKVTFYLFIFFHLFNNGREDRKNNDINDEFLSNLFLGTKENK